MAGRPAASVHRGEVIAQRGASAHSHPILPIGGQTQELLLHRVHPGEVRSRVLVTAALAGRQMKSAAHEVPGQAWAAEVDEGGDLLLLLRRRRTAETRPENPGDAAVEQCRGEFDGVAGIDAGIQVVVPAGAAATR